VSVCVCVSAARAHRAAAPVDNERRYVTSRVIVAAAMDRKVSCWKGACPFPAGAYASDGPWTMACADGEPRTTDPVRNETARSDAVV
jgi:hypothetical protein